MNFGWILSEFCIKSLSFVKYVLGVCKHCTTISKNSGPSYGPPNIKLWLHWNGCNYYYFSSNCGYQVPKYEHNCTACFLSKTTVYSLGIQARNIKFICYLARLILRRLKMEAICSSETSVDFQRTRRRYTPEDSTHLMYEYLCFGRSEVLTAVSSHR
jgi:hypothetical protein